MISTMMSSEKISLRGYADGYDRSNETNVALVRPIGWVGLYLCHAFRGSRCGGGGAWLLRSVFRGAFGLQLLGMKHAVAAKVAVCQGLRLILERVGRGFGSGIVDG